VEDFKEEYNLDEINQIVMQLFHEKDKLDYFTTKFNLSNLEQIFKAVIVEKERLLKYFKRYTRFLMLGRDSLNQKIFEINLDKLDFSTKRDETALLLKYRFLIEEVLERDETLMKKKSEINDILKINTEGTRQKTGQGKKMMDVPRGWSPVSPLKKGTNWSETYKEKEANCRMGRCTSRQVQTAQKDSDKFKTNSPFLDIQEPTKDFTKVPTNKFEVQDRHRHLGKTMTFASGKQVLIQSIDPTPAHRSQIKVGRFTPPVNLDAPPNQTHATIPLVSEKGFSKNVNQPKPTLSQTQPRPRSRAVSGNQTEVSAQKSSPIGLQHRCKFMEKPQSTDFNKKVQITPGHNRDSSDILRLKTTATYSIRAQKEYNSLVKNMKEVSDKKKSLVKTHYIQHGSKEEAINLYKIDDLHRHDSEGDAHIGRGKGNFFSRKQAKGKTLGTIMAREEAQIIGNGGKNFYEPVDKI
jgi:hypothetical protein